MKAKVKVRFFDIAESIQREVDDVIEVSKERFDEVNSKIEGALEEVKAARAAKTAKKEDGK